MSEPDLKGRELFIVDNSVSGWTGIRYLSEWADLAKSFEHIADQLGHIDTSLAHKVYGRFKRTIEERIPATATTTATNGISPLTPNAQPIAQTLLS